ERLPRKPPAVARLGWHRHRGASLAFPAEHRFHLRHWLQLHPHELWHGDAEGEEDRARDLGSLCDQQGCRRRSGGGRRCRPDARRAARGGQGSAQGQTARPRCRRRARDRRPILSILSNNFSMAIELKVMPVSTEKYRSTDISGNYADFAKALGGYGERVTEPGQIKDAIKRGIQKTKEGTPALLEFITEK